jgi:hypothetical protein
MSLDSLTFFDRGPACLDQESLITRLRTNAHPLLSAVVESYRHTWRPLDCETDTKATMLDLGSSSIIQLPKR